MAESEAHTSSPFWGGDPGLYQDEKFDAAARLSFFTASLHLPESHKGSGSVSGIC